MMETTDDLIRNLVASDKGAGRLPSPWRRVSLWLTVALPYVALIVIGMGVRADLNEMSSARFLVEQIATLLTAITAAFAAFCAVVPGISRRLLLLPLLPLTVWLGSLGHGCLQDWLRYGAAGLTIEPDWHCAPRIVIVGAIPAIAMFVMLRKGAPLAPRLTMALGALAAAALGNFALRLFHPPDASLTVLVWHFGGVALLSVLAGALGRYLDHWPRAPRLV
ncbi:MAG: NrsF family protein [Gammaproteobacteria bacterium]